MWAKWLEFTYKERFLVGTSLARIGFGFVILFFYCIHYRIRHFLWFPGGVLDADIYRSGYLTIFQFASNTIAFDILFHLGIIVTILYIIGYKGRITSILFFIFTYSILQRNWLLGDGGDNLLRVLLVYMMFTKNTAYFSFDSKKFWEKHRTGVQDGTYRISTLLHNFAALACIIQICILYFTAGMYQAMGNLWTHGTALYYIMQVDQFTFPVLKNILYDSPLLLTILTYLTIIVKVSFPFMLFNRITKYISVFSIALFHLGIGIGMGLVSFSAIMIIADLMIISDDDYRILRRTFAEKMRKQQIMVFYDGWCPFCTKTTKKIHKMDYLNLIDFVSFRDKGIIQENKLSIEKLEEMIHSRKKDAEDVKIGIYSFIQISKRVIPMWCILPALYVSVWFGFGQKLYKFIADRRIIIPSNGCNDSTECKIDFEKKESATKDESDKNKLQ
ncbi:DCC1-like thiol-disulfide oxidoreductase family protein [Bacillus thuringiensis]|uniref:DCC1-like thiol-disulfide oxidoreductase family protein n=1 Tax=Bacillus thuringiensis TaxID=1428 RepID=UPI001F54A505|nr:DCC1-like thiol-disulfide oxidoreductase family protein [Bacillus thuringiensis]